MADALAPMTWAERTIFKLKMLAFALAVGCPIGLVLIARDTLHEIDSNQWPSVEGQVQNVMAMPTPAKVNEPIEYFGRALYSYAVDGQNYTSYLTDLSSGTKRSSQIEALADVSQYAPGTKIAVFYNPANPVEAVLQTGVPSNHLIVLIGLCIGFVGGVIGSFFIVRGWRHKRSQKRTVTENS